MPLFNTNGYSQYIFQTGTTPSTQTKIIYISATSGNDLTGQVYLAQNFTDEADALDPSFTPMSFATCKAAISHVYSNYGSNGWCTGSFWFLIERGTTCDSDDRLVSSVHGAIFPFRGVNEEHRVIVGAYGDTNLPRPIIRYNVDGSWSIRLQADPGFHDYITIKNIHFYATTRDPSHPDYDVNAFDTLMTPIGSFYGNDRIGAQNIFIIEDCEISYYSGAIEIQGTESSTGWFDGVVINRNKIHHIFANNIEYSSGIYASKSRGAKLIENVLHMIGHNRDTPTAYGTFFNQGFYLGDNLSIEVIGNFIDNVSHGGIQCRKNSTHEINSNLVTNCAIGISIGHDQNEYDNYYAEVYQPSQVPKAQIMNMRRNVIAKPQDLFRPEDPRNAQDRRGTAIAINRVHGCIVDDNICILPGDSTGESYGLNVGEIGGNNAQFVPGSITHSITNNIFYNWNDNGYVQLLLGQSIPNNPDGSTRIDVIPSTFELKNNKFIDNLTQSGILRNVWLFNNETLVNSDKISNNKFFSTPDMSSRRGSTILELSDLNIDGFVETSNETYTNLDVPDYLDAISDSLNTFDEFVDACLDNGEHNYQDKYTSIAYINYVRSRFSKAPTASVWPNSLVFDDVIEPTPIDPSGPPELPPNPEISYTFINNYIAYGNGNLEDNVTASFSNGRIYKWSPESGNNRVGNLYLEDPNGNFTLGEYVYQMNNSYTGFTGPMGKIIEIDEYEETSQLVYDQTIRFKINYDGNELFKQNSYTKDAFVYNSAAEGYVVDWTPATATGGTYGNIRVLPSKGEFKAGQNLIYNSSNATGGYISEIISKPELVYRSGTVLHLQNIRPVERLLEQKEQIKLIVEF